MYQASIFAAAPATFRQVWKGGRVELTSGHQLPVSRVSDRMIREYRIEAVLDPMTRDWVGADTVMVD